MPDGVSTGQRAQGLISTIATAGAHAVCWVGEDRPLELGVDTGSSGGGEGGDQSNRNKKPGAERRTRLRGLTIRLWTLVRSGEQWEVPGCLEAEQHRDNVGTGRRMKVFGMVWKRKVMRRL